MQLWEISEFLKQFRQSIPKGNQMGINSVHSHLVHTLCAMSHLASYQSCTFPLLSNLCSFFVMWKPGNKMLTEQLPGLLSDRGCHARCLREWKWVADLLFSSSLRNSWYNSFCTIAVVNPLCDLSGYHVHCNGGIKPGLASPHRLL